MRHFEKEMRDSSLQLSLWCNSHYFKVACSYLPFTAPPERCLLSLAPVAICEYMCENKSQESLEKLTKPWCTIECHFPTSVMRGGVFSDVAVVRVAFLIFIFNSSFFCSSSEVDKAFGILRYNETSLDQQDSMWNDGQLHVPRSIWNVDIYRFLNALRYSRVPEAAYTCVEGSLP